MSFDDEIFLKSRVRESRYGRINMDSWGLVKCIAIQNAFKNQAQ